jgi:DNA-binding NarL/FixJ family response regulator
MVIGTPAYLSPEQAQGLKLDHRTDIYSLGIVLYEMATGQLPFNADDISALLLQQVKQPAPPPRLIVPDLPLALESVILKCLEKNPARRFQSCNAMASALEIVYPASAPTSDSPHDAPTHSRRPAWADTLQSAGQAAPAPIRPKPTLKVILADDHAILRKTLASFLETRDDFVVVAEAGDGESALQQTLAILPDILLLDLNMPGKGGLDILPTIREKAPSVKVLVLTGREEEAYIVRALRMGAHGYILKTADENELIDSLLRVAQGQLVLGRGVTEKIVHVVSGDPTKKELLDDNERKMLVYVAAGYPNDAIARELDLTVPVVIESLAHIMDKLGASDRNAAALVALKHGFILLEDVHHLASSSEG